MSRQKRIAAVHDISGFGKCSLTVALPIISAAGIEACAVPTAVLSTHTGGFKDYTYRDLTSDLRPFTRHWKGLGLSFDAIYTGFLGSEEQLEIVGEMFDSFRTPDNLIMVDPVMADNGFLYATFPQDFPKGMAKLCAKADLIIPNITEACLLTGQPYAEGPFDHSYIEKLLRTLSELGPRCVILTGVCFDEDTLGAACYTSGDGRISYAMSKRIEGMYHGTGDVFGSALLGALMKGFGLGEAAQIAVDFVTEAIIRTKAAGNPTNYGVNFEEGLGEYISVLNSPCLR